MKKAELEFALRKAGEIAHEKDFIIFGSQAIWSIVSNAPEIVVISSEVDLYRKNSLNAVSLLVRELGPRTPFFQKHGYYVDCVDPGLATLPEGWTERLVAFRTEDTGGVTGWCLEIHDLVASKLAAGREKILSLLRLYLGANFSTRASYLTASKSCRSQLQARSRCAIR